MLAGLVPSEIPIFVAIAALDTAVLFYMLTIFFVAVFLVVVFIFFLMLVFIFFLILGTITEAELFEPVGLEVAATRQSFCL